MLKIAVLVPALALSSVAFSYPIYLQNFQSYYEANNLSVKELLAKESCGLCHNRASGGGARNAYGSDFQSVTLGRNAGFQGLEFLDSDGDGFNNLEEIYLQTAPGKTADAPKGRVELTFDATTNNITAKVVAFGDRNCSKLELKSFGVSFAGKNDVSFDKVTADQVVAITGTKGAVLAKCQAEGFVGSILLK